VSDFLGDEEPTRIAASALLAAHCDVHAVHVLAREELEPSPQAIRATDPENESITRPFDSAMQSRYLSNFADWRQRVAAQWRHGGATWTSVRTDEDPALGIRRVIGASSGDAAVIVR
jgi:uncharacterized protein (DUF58 family)